jgi:hypothetical protein
MRMFCRELALVPPYPFFPVHLTYSRMITSFRCQLNGGQMPNGRVFRMLIFGAPDKPAELADFLRTIADKIETGELGSESSEFRYESEDMVAQFSWRR